MPAIQPARLRLQVTRLAELFNQPRAFSRALHGFLQLYADRTRQAGQFGNPPPLISSYNIPRPVLRHILRELHQPASQNTLQTLELCQTLWAEPYYEFRQIAGYLVGIAPLAPAELVINQIKLWLELQPEEHISTVLLDQGMNRIRQEKPELLLALAKEWLGQPKSITQKYALCLLHHLAVETETEHLPAIYPLITPLIRRSSPALRPDLIKLVSTAAAVSPQETSYMLRQSLEAPDNTDADWLIRQVMNEFPIDFQDSLKAAMLNSKSALP